MATRAPIPGLNPDVLVWARRRAGQDVAEVARRLSKSPEDILAWETGESSPTYVQLEKLAYQVYKRPVALFFFPEPPEEDGPENRFRTLPDFELADLAPDTRFRIRDGLAKQLALHDLTGGHNPADRKVFRDIVASIRSVPAEIAAEVRSYLGVTVEDQRAWRNITSALDAWREGIEAHGVFAFKASFRQREISGFCLHGDEFPIIYLNNSVAKTRQIFTLFHELAHLLLQTNGITKRDDAYISRLEGDDRAVEVFCNAFAGEFLAPRESLAALIELGSPSDDAVGHTASQLKVSREMIMRRLLDLGVVSQRHYVEKAAEWAADYLEREKRDSGGNYYYTQGAYLGKGFLTLAFQQLYRGAISRSELADILGVKATSINGLEQRVLAGSA